MRKLFAALFVLAVLVIAAPAQAQEVIEITEADVDNFVGLLRTNLLNERADLVGQAMQFNAEESATFWPMYTEYDRAMTEFGERRWQLIKNYAMAYESMDDATAEALLQQAMEMRAQRTQHQAEFIASLTETMGARIAARFYQVDNQLTNLLDLQIAQELPLVQKPQ